MFRYGFKTGGQNGEKRRTRRKGRGDLHTTLIRRPAVASQWTQRKLLAENWRGWRKRKGNKKEGF